MKKILSFVLTLIMAFSFMSVTSFADDSQTDYANLSTAVAMDNPNCIHSKDAKIIVKITKDNNTIVNAELVYDEFLGYNFEGHVDGADDIIKDIGPEYDEMFDSDTYVDVLKEAGYTIEIVAEDNDPDHEFTVDEVDYYILTKATFVATINMLANYTVAVIIENCEGDAEALAEWNELFGGALTAEDGVAYLDGEEVTYRDLLDAYKNVPGSGINEDSIKEFEEMLAAMETGEYLGNIMIDASLKCSCPYMDEYTVYHEYYDVNGKQVGQVYVDGEVAGGETVKVSDLALLPEYNGKTYEVEGYYIYDWDKDDWNYDNEIREFQVHDGYEEVLVKYVEVPPAADDAGTPPADTNDGQGNTSDKAADTGDSFNILPFAGLMAIAAVGMVAALRRRA